MRHIILEARFVDHESDERRQVRVDGDTHSITEVGHELGKPDVSFAEQCLLLPGFVDLHIHAREDSSGTQNYKEDFLTASEAAVNGGVVAVADMPNNPHPPVDEQSYEQKQALTAKSRIPVLLYAGVGPSTHPLSIEVPYKLFMGPSIGPLFFTSNEQIEEAVKRYAGKAISFHCEDPVVLERNSGKPTHEQRRPPEAEIEAIKFALELTERYNLQAKICHVSTAEGLQLCAEAKKAGLQVSVEVTPHHLYFDTEMFDEQRRRFLQVNPPIRGAEDQAALRAGLKEGVVDYLASDHAPHSVAEKEAGISGVPNLDTYGLIAGWLIRECQVSPQTIARVCSHNPGRFFNQFMDTKLGAIKAGYEGKFTVLDFSQETAVTRDYVKSKCGWSPFEGERFGVGVGSWG